MNEIYKETLNTLGYYEVTPKPSSKELELHYKNKYYQESLGTYSKEYSADDLRYFSNVAEVANQTSMLHKLDRTLLDLGCGEGFFSRHFQKSGWRISCSDFSDFGVSQHNKEVLPFFSSGDIYDSVANICSKNEKFGLVNLQNVLEHVIDPICLLSSIKSLLDQTSALRIRIPNDYSDFQHDLVKSGLSKNTWFSPPEHLSYFNKTSLINLLEYCGYEIISLQADFPIELFLANPNSNYWQDRSLGKGAHQARTFCENHLIEKDINAYIEYSESAAKLGFGRELIAYARPKI